MYRTILYTSMELYDNKWSKNFNEAASKGEGGFFTVGGEVTVTPSSWEHSSRLQQSQRCRYWFFGVYTATVTLSALQSWAHESAPKTAYLSIQPFLHRTSVWPLSQWAASMLCMRCGLKHLLHHAVYKMSPESLNKTTRNCKQCLRGIAILQDIYISYTGILIFNFGAPIPSFLYQLETFGMQEWTYGMLFHTKFHSDCYIMLTCEGKN